MLAALSRALRPAAGRLPPRWALPRGAPHLSSSAGGGKGRHSMSALRRLEARANARPEDTGAQKALLRALNEAGFSEAVLARCQSGRFATSEGVAKQYVAALSALGQLEEAALGQLTTAAPATGPAHRALSTAVAAGAGTSAHNPLYVMAGRSWKRALLQAASSLLGLVIVITAIATMIDEKGGMMGKMGPKNAVKMVASSDRGFDDVKGADEALAELREIVEYLQSPGKFTRLGGKLPKGVLLTGPPGTGKTLLARAIAGEAGVPFLYSSGSEFEEMFVGVGARRVRDMFEAAKAHAPCIIFIDEIDAVGSTRYVKEQTSMKMTLNQLLVEMDGFEQNNGIVVIGATNFPDILDSALTRPGRFDKHVTVPLPDVRGRRQILGLYTDKMPVADDVDLDELARGTTGMSGAELANLVNQAAVKASLDGLPAVDRAALEYAKDKILMGPERKSAVISPESARLTAYHEGGHALVAIRTDGAHPVHKATIMPRGQALGMVTQLPEGDQLSMSRKQMLARLDVCMGGRVAEELVFGAEEVTSGASSDLMQATRLARTMVTKYGMTESVGKMFLDREDLEQLSPETKEFIDREVRALLTASYDRASAIIRDNRRDLERIAQALLEHETLSGAELREVLAGRKLSR